MNLITIIFIALGALVVASLIGIPIGIWRVKSNLKKINKKLTPENIQELVDKEKQQQKEVEKLKNDRKEKLKGREGIGSGYIVPVDKVKRAKQLTATGTELEGLKRQLREQQRVSVSEDSSGTTKD